MYANSKPKVLMLGWEYSPLIAGGLGVVARDITESIVNQNGAEITYLLPRIPDQLRIANSPVQLKSAHLEAVRYIYAPTDLGGYAYAKSEHIPVKHVYNNIPGNSQHQSKSIYSSNLFTEIEKYTEAAVKEAKENKYSLVHNHDWMTSRAAKEVKSATKAPMLMHVHATEFDRALNNPHPSIFEEELRGFEAADKIIAVSELTKQQIIKNYAIPESKVVVIHNAINKVEGKFGPIAKSISPNDKVVLFLARLTAMKGANYLLKAAPDVLKVLPDTKFLFVGAGELLEELIQMSVNLSIAHKVTFTGFLPHDQINRAYSLADVYVLSSVTEPFGITPLEAIQNGTPVILSKQSGVSEVIKNVLKVDFWDTRKLAEQIISVLKYGALAREIVRNSQEELSGITWDKQSKKIIALYNSLKR